MKYIKFVLAGILFGIVMTKAEIISWFRIYEMFHFQSFHMYGIIGSAILLGMIGTWLIKALNIKDISGSPIVFQDKNKSIARYLLGGIIFGLGWALSGACPGPMFILVGYGYLPVLIVIGGALMGTFVYGLIRNRLPH